MTTRSRRRAGACFAFGDRVQLVRASFRDLRAELAARRSPPIDAVLLDLGVSSHQLDAPERGFRFAEATAAETPLDMRMDRRSPVTAAEILRTRSAEELAAIFREGAELPGAARLARRLVEARQRAPLATTRDLLRVIEAARVGGGRRHHPATLVFQALRIAVNDEIGALREGLDAAILALRPGGRLVVIAYHSLEDRCVKHRLREAERGCTCPPRIPVCICGGVPLLRVLTRRPLRPGPAEIARQPAGPLGPPARRRARRRGRMSAAHPLRAWSSRVARWLGPPRTRRPARARADLVGRDFAQRRAAGRPWPGAFPRCSRACCSPPSRSPRSAST